MFSDIHAYFSYMTFQPSTATHTLVVQICCTKTTSSEVTVWHNSQYEVTIQHSLLNIRGNKTLSIMTHRCATHVAITWLHKWISELGFMWSFDVLSYVDCTRFNALCWLLYCMQILRLVELKPVADRMSYEYHIILGFLMRYQTNT